MAVVSAQSAPDNAQAVESDALLQTPSNLQENSTGSLTVDDDLDNDSAYAEDNESYTTSLKSSIYNYPEQYGRRYHAFRAGREAIAIPEKLQLNLAGHFLPNDEKEKTRQDIHHTLMSVLLHKKLFYAPINADSARTLDLGTGWGFWVTDFADAHPGAHVIGNDLSPIQPIYVPPNVEFVVDDFEDEWYYEHNPFDFIHGRYLGGSVRDWPRLMRMAYKNLKPGGWVEFQDWDTMIESHDGSVTPETSIWKWHRAGIDRIGKVATLRPGPELEGWIRGAGFQNVTVEKLLIPLGSWPKDKHLKLVGSLNRLQLEEGLESLSIGTYSRTAGEDPSWSMDEIQVMIADVRADLRNKNLHGLYTFYVVYGQKPNDETD